MSYSPIDITPILMRHRIPFRLHNIAYRYRFPNDADGLQLILSRYIENDLEMVRFKV